MTLSAHDLEDLYYAATLLENPGLAVKITNIVGVPVERAFALLPAGWSDVVRKSTHRALETAVNSALFTLRNRKTEVSADKFHTLMAAGLGAAGGFWGLAGLGVELPVSTTVMMRSIADIARSEGHDLKDPAVKIACLEVFALGGTSDADDGAETSYFALRASLAKSVADAVRHIVSKGLTEKSAPALVRLITQVSSRFGLQVTEKVAAQSLPLLGALGGAAINSLFIDHFQTMARGHFIVLRLEKKYGREEIQEIYTTFAK
ncbi:MAG: EcsC family protein [Desulfopila sp.]|nr:EcsC family protein [Desulfopila sp.]